MSFDPIAVTHEACVAKTAFEIGDCVASFWKQLWEMARQGSPGPEARDEVSLGEVLHVARLQSTGEQVRHLPTRCLELCFALLL